MADGILIVEDEPAIAELVAVNLRHGGFGYRLAGDAGAARQRVDEELPALVLLDWMLPGESGLSLARYWRSQERTRTLPIIMLTARSDDSDIIMGLDAGVDDYIVKPFSPQEMLARIRALLRRSVPETAGQSVTVAGVTLDPQKRTVCWQGEAVRMGPTEFKLFNYFMNHPDRIFSRGQLLDKVWGDHVFIEERTVDVHIKRLRSFFDKNGIPNLIETVRGAGYQLNSALSVPSVP